MFPDPLLSPHTPPLLTMEARFRGVPLTVRLHESAGIFWAQGLGSPRFLGVFDDENDGLRAAIVASNWREVRAQVQRQLVGERIGRALALPDPRLQTSGFFRLVWREEESFAFVIHPRSGEAVAFEPDILLDGALWAERDDFWARRWGKEWRNEASDLRLSLQFLESSKREREQWGLFWGKGSWKELSEVARMAAVADPDCDLTRPLLLNASVRYTNQRPTEFDADRPLSGRLKRMLGELLDRNRAYLSDRNGLRELAPTPFHFAALPLRAPTLRLEIEQPSAHEQLEARFWMREWVARHAPTLARDWKARL